MIDLGTLAGLHERQHQLAAYCPRCDRWRMVPLAELVAAWQGPRRLPVRVRCAWCGSPGQLQVRPPALTRPSSVGWIQIPAG